MYTPTKNTNSSTYLNYFFSLLLTISGVLFGQAQCGNNILFIVDDSGSVDSSERIDMRNSIQALSDAIYLANSNSKVGIVQYGQELRAPTADVSYYISLPLTVNPTIILENDPGGNIFISDVLPNSIGAMVSDNLFGSGGEFETVNSIFIFTDAFISGFTTCDSILSNCGSNCTVTAVSCGYDYLFDLSELLGSIPISVFRVIGGPGTASGMEQNGGVLIERNDFIITDNQIAELTESLSCINANFNFLNTCFGDATSFSLLTSEVVDSVLWDFGDGFTSTELNPNHTYTSPGTYTVTLTVTSDSETVIKTEEVIISETPIANPVTEYRVCDDSSNNGVEVFNLTTKTAEVIGSQTNPDLIVRYFESLSDAQNNQNPLTTTYSNQSNSQEIFVRIFSIDNPECYEVTSFLLIVDAQPTANAISNFALCDDAVADGFEIFNLDDKNPEILGSQSNSVYDVNYYTTLTDAQNHLNELPLSYTNITNNEIIFAKIFNIANPSCYDITSFSLVVNSSPIAFPIQDFTVCENNRPFIDLVQFDSDILNGQLNSDFNVNYYISLENATDGFNPIIGEFEIMNSPEVIYAKVENIVTGCSDITSYNIVTYEFPFEDFEAFVTCDPKNYVLDATIDGASVDYSWEDGSIGATLTVNDFGTYNVTITAESCTTTRQFELIKGDDCFIPAGISPDGDGLNDVFDVSFLEINTIMIYNRYGMKIYSKENYKNEWNGQSDKGHELPSGTYYYIINTIENANLIGWVYLSR